MRPWTRWSICSSFMSRRPMSRIAHRWLNWPGRCSRSPGRMSSWLTWIRATWERRLKRRQLCMATTGSGQTYRSQTRLSTTAAEMGGEEKLRLDHSRLPPGPRLRKTRNYPWSLPFPGLRPPHDRQPLHSARLKLITDSRNRRAELILSYQICGAFMSRGERLRDACGLVLTADPEVIPIAKSEWQSVF